MQVNNQFATSTTIMLIASFPRKFEQFENIKVLLFSENMFEEYCVFNYFTQ